MIASHANTTENVEVTRVSSRGIWLRAHNQKFFLSYYDFPWFKHKTVEAVMTVEQPSPDSIHWPQLNLTLDINRIRHLQHCPSRQQSVA